MRARAIFLLIMEISHENEDFWLFHSYYGQNKFQNGLVGVCAVLYGFAIAFKTCAMHFEKDSRCAQAPTMRAKAIFLLIMKISHENENFWLFQNFYGTKIGPKIILSVSARLYMVMKWILLIFKKICILVPSPFFGGELWENESFYQNSFDFSYVFWSKVLNFRRNYMNISVSITKNILWRALILDSVLLSSKLANLLVVGVNMSRDMCN